MLRRSPCYKSARTPVNLQVLASFRLFEYLEQFVQATVRGSYPENTDLMFKPDPTLLGSQGLSSYEAVLKVDGDGSVDPSH